MSTIIEKVAALQAERKKTAAADWLELVAAIARGKEVAPTRIEDGLNRSGKTLDDLKTAMEQREKRVALRATLDTLPALEAEAKDLDRRLAEADKDLETARAKHESIAIPISQRGDEVGHLIQACDKARDELIATCPHTDVLDALAETERSLGAARRQQQELVAAAGLRAQADVHLAQAKRLVEPDKATELEKEAKALIEKAERLEAQAPAVKKQINELVKRADALREKHLAP